MKPRVSCWIALSRWKNAGLCWSKPGHAAAHTGFAQITRLRVLQRFYDEDEVTLAALLRMQDRLLDLENEDV